ncbi:MAG: hypothetical protein IPK83_12130 [Planctomycetes bacterium]|nr:hypothetical protein [Planctomycetota bacterium]
MKDLNRDPDFQSDLLGYHLGLMDDVERRQFEAGFGDPVRLQAACRSLESILSPLDADPLPGPSGGFVDRVLAGIDNSQSILPFKKGSLAPASGQPIVTGGGSLFSMRELMGIAAAIAMFAGILIPGYYTARQTAQKVACAHNLKQVGTGIASYAEMSDNFMPFFGMGSSNSKWATAMTSEQDRTVPNSRHLYRLVQGNLVPAEAFVCPGAPGDYAMSAESQEQFAGFADPRNISYASNLVTRPWERNVFAGNMPLVGCMTPLVDENRRLVSSENAPPNSVESWRRLRAKRSAGQHQCSISHLAELRREQ